MFSDALAVASCSWIESVYGLFSESHTHISSSSKDYKFHSFPTFYLYCWIVKSGGLRMFKLEIGLEGMFQMKITSVGIQKVIKGCYLWCCLIIWNLCHIHEVGEWLRKRENKEKWPAFLTFHCRVRCQMVNTVVSRTLSIYGVFSSNIVVNWSRLWMIPRITHHK